MVRPAICRASASSGSPANRSGYPWTTIAAQDPDGTTTGSSPRKAFSACRATGRACSGCPELHPGCPQQVCARGTTTSTPTRSSTVAAARDTDGAIASARQVRMSIARIA